MWLCAVLRMKQGVGKMLQTERVTRRNGRSVSRPFNQRPYKASSSFMAFWEGDDIISFSFLACSFKGNLASSVLICLCPVPGALKGEGHKCMLVARVNVFFSGINACLRHSVRNQSLQLLCDCFGNWLEKGMNWPPGLWLLDIDKRCSVLAGLCVLCGLELTSSSNTGSASIFVSAGLVTATHCPSFSAV